MNQRQEHLLKIIATCYIKSAQPVSSKLICEAGEFDLSSATIRNEMAELEDEGYIFHPHTSAGRVPTEKGYRYYVEHFIEESPLPKRQQEALEHSFDATTGSDTFKQLARKLAELADSTVFIAFSPNDFYYTGLSNLLAQPEFTEREVMYNLTKVIDHFDRILPELFKSVEDVDILIGNENPLAVDCSAVVTRYVVRGNSGLLGIVGPVRMDYQQNYGLIRFGQSLIKDLR